MDRAFVKKSQPLFKKYRMRACTSGFDIPKIYPIPNFVFSFNDKPQWSADVYKYETRSENAY